MLLVQFKRDQEQHRLHLDRIRKMRPVLDANTPESLGLKHLALRPKKMQLIEDRRQEVAKENAKLMGLMTKIMNDKRPQPKYSRPPSLNEVERKMKVDKLNFENKLMLQRLNKVQPTISNSSLTHDFKKHCKAEANLRRRQYKPMSLPKDLYKAKENSSLFDSSTYLSQHQSYSPSSGEKGPSPLETADGPIQSMSDFRRHVISTKKAAARSMYLDESKRMSPTGLPASGRQGEPVKDSMYELSYKPT